jgi:hypothetical protein
VINIVITVLESAGAVEEFHRIARVEVLLGDVQLGSEMGN